MREDIDILLERNIQQMLDDLILIEEDKQSEYVENISKLHKMRVEEAKLKPVEEKGFDLEKELLPVAMKVFEIVVPLICYGRWMNKGFKFEQEGVVSSTFFRNFIGKLRP